MKKIIKILTFIVFIFILNSCFFNKDNEKQISDAKKQMWVIEQDNNKENNSGTIDKKPIEEIENNETIGNNNWNEEKQNNIEITNLTDEVFLKLDDLSDVNLLSWEIEIKWTTLTQVDEISVEFKNDSSHYPNDNYKLQKFKSWDKTFVYRAFSKFETLDFWINEYIITAKAWNKISKIKLIINVEKETTSTSNKKAEILKDINFDSLPIWENFWEPKQIWDWKITYSDIKWLEIIKVAKNSFDCSINPKTNDYYISEILDKNLNSAYWWNTCRPFWENKWISFFVLRLDWNNYIYEKHIYLNNWIYWIYELDKWNDLVETKDNTDTKNKKLQEKNTKLKETNSTYTTIEIVNDLFTKIINNI